jgi:hypothetical protein
MSPTPRRPWLDSAAARAIGPVERVCAPAWAEVAMIGWVIVTVLAGGWFPLLGLFALFGYFFPEAISSTSALGCGGVICLALSAGLAFLGARHLRQRLLLGERGVALWAPARSRVVMWDELDTVRYRVWSDRQGRPFAVVLVRQDGVRLVITGFFADHHVVIQRILEELARRSGSPGGAMPPTDSNTGAIIPAERRVSEPGG